MGACTAVIKKKNPRPYGRSVIAQLSLSSSYATGGDSVTAATFFPPAATKRLSSLIVSGGHTTPSGHHVEVIPPATESGTWLLRVRNVTTGAEIASTTNLSTESVLVEAFSSPYK